MAPYVDPSSLSHQSSMSDISDHSRSEPTPGPSRKRARLELSAEERKEARAHRNRIAAQNSRDKRKAQFSALESRVRELEDENRRLRAGMSLTELQRVDDRRSDLVERERAREKENMELRERIKSLEKGWETVMKVLSAQGLPAAMVSSPSTPSNTTESDNHNSPSAFPVLVPHTPVLPITPSPSLSSASLLPESEPESTRHLAAGGLGASIPGYSFGPSSSTLSTSHITTPAPSVDETAVEEWIRQILATSPTVPTAPLPPVDRSPETAPTSPAVKDCRSLGMDVETGSNWSWEKRSDLGSEAELQRVLGIIPFTVTQPESEGALGVDFGLDTTMTESSNWDFSGREHILTSSSKVGVF